MAGLKRKLSQVGQDALERLELRSSIRKADPHCKIVFLVDEKIDAKIAEEVKEAKLMGLIDQFIFSSISASYLAALMETL